MSYTQMIRNYLKDRKGGFFDILKESIKFKLIPIKTLMRILNRLEVEGLLTKVCKGLYFINDETGYSKEKLIDYFTSYGRGMLVGNALYKKLGITDQECDEVIIYTNAISNNKNIGNIHLKKRDLLVYFKTEEAIITVLELLEKGIDDIVDFDFMQVVNVLQRFSLIYNNLAFEEVVRKIHYQPFTIKKLKEQLDRLLVPNRCMEIYQKVRSAQKELF